MDFNKGAQLIASKCNFKVSASAAAAVASKELEKFPDDRDDTEAVLNEK